MEREWREASDLRPSVVGLAIVLLVAAALRFWALGSGIPFGIGVDEPQIMSRVVRMMTSGDYNPHFFDYPGLYLYVQVVVASARFLFGVFNGEWGSLNQTNPTDFYLWARAVTALAGTATVYLVFLIGNRWGARHGLLAAGIMAVMPQHVRESHYVLTDVPMTLFVALSFLLTLRALEQRTLRAFAWAGFAGGLATATKYYGGVILVAPFVAALVGADVERRAKVALSVVAAAIGAFLLAAPYTVLDLPGFLNGFATLSTSFRGGAPPEPGWLIYLKHMRLSLWWPGMLLLAWGTVHAIVRAVTGPGKERFLLLVLFPALYFALVATRTLIFGRYLLPILPFVSLLVAIAIVSGVTLLRRFSIPRSVRTALIVALTVVAILPPSVGSIGFERMAGRRSTGQAAYEWMLKNVPAGSHVTVELIGFELPGTRYHKTYVPRLIDEKEAAFVAGKTDYVLTSADVFNRYLSQPQAHPDEAAAYTRLFRSMALLITFRPSDGMQGPELRVYKCQPAPPGNDNAAAPIGAVVETGQDVAGRQRERGATLAK